MIRIAMGCFLALLASTPCHAQSVADMQSACRTIPDAQVKEGKIFFKEESFTAGICWGAFGVLQDDALLLDDTGRPLFHGCPPTKVRRNQLVVVFLKYAEKHPQRLGERFLPFARESLTEAFPCSKGN